MGCRTRFSKWVPMEQWKVLKRDCLPAYITWEQLLAQTKNRCSTTDWG